MKHIKHSKYISVTVSVNASNFEFVHQIVFLSDTQKGNTSHVLFSIYVSHKKRIGVALPPTSISCVNTDCVLSKKQPNVNVMRLFRLIELCLKMFLAGVST